MNKVFNFGLILTTAMLTAQANAYSPSREGKHTISPLLGFMGSGANTVTDSIGGVDSSTSLPLTGAFGIGGDYEYGLVRDELSVGGFFRYYTTTDTVGRTDYTDTIMLLGGLSHLTFYNTDRFRAYLGSGLTFLKVSAKVTPAGGTSSTYSPPMTLGFPLQLGLGYKLNDTMMLGIEHMQVMALGEKINGWPVSDFMFRFSFTL